MAPVNKAVFITEPKAYPLKVESTPYPTAGDGEIVIKVAAAAFNPVDWFIQIMGKDLFDWLQYPFVGGNDMAGTVVEVGPNASKFKIGDRVLGLAGGFEARFGAFQHYATLNIKTVTPIPADLDFTEAAVVPLGLATAACALYQKDFLALDPPSLSPKPNGKTLLIWAGASSVGTNAIQLAVASGYEVYTTSSPKNFDYCKQLGAARVFDYHSPTITEDLIEAFKGKTCAGGVVVHRGSDKIVFEVVRKSEGDKFVACASPPGDIPEGIQAKMVFAGTLRDNEVGSLIFDKFLPEALSQKKYRCLPKPLIVGHGLEHVQAAFDQGKAGGVSAQKLVVTL
ncbi:GroES-like protein [Annulohypoxylon maeteangense]|uniref:GroES-like protein n=1 Tax=Annulohypoxylon maeteangense TaxID=1927788 RepID=UPI0020088533|nr:GroES-like protein [Annulohypoxylon maeteangense]KAI0889209.1 GroES-like protein [Annulohypoxylon maeteangense]